MGLFRKKQMITRTEIKCPMEGCSFTCNNPINLKKHTDWKHPELTLTAVKGK